VITRKGAVVLVSKTGYKKEHDSLLQSLIERNIQLFCAVGKNCREWEDAIDCLYISNETGRYKESVLLTTSHPDESVQDVIEFASLSETDIEVIEV
jgi:hypothetical protein